jgi:type II secretory pathway component PulJ
MPWSVAFMVVAIVLITSIARVAIAGTRQAKRQDAAIPADTMRANEEIRQLKDRIQVLERVITDNHGSSDLSRQIDELRDR